MTSSTACVSYFFGYEKDLIFFFVHTLEGKNVQYHPDFCEIGKPDIQTKPLRTQFRLPKRTCVMLQGEGVLYEEENLNQVFGQKADQFNFDKFKYMCIMSGILGNDFPSSLM